MPAEDRHHQAAQGRPQTAEREVGGAPGFFWKPATVQLQLCNYNCPCSGGHREMARGLSAQLLDALDLAGDRQPGFYASLEDLEQATPLLPYVQAVRHVWDVLKPGGVLYVNRSPAAYFKEINHDITDGEARQWQQCLWNHAITPMLVVATPRKVYVYSGRALPARREEAVDDDEGNRLVLTLERTAEVLEQAQLVQSIQTGQLLQDNESKFRREQAVDQYLLQNLLALRNRLADRGLPQEAIPNLLTRLLFSCYLVERGIVLGENFANPSLAHLGREHTLPMLLRELEPKAARDTLCDLFDGLKARFNGSLFYGDLKKARQELSTENMKVVRKFLNGDSLGDGQLTLGFWAYDFSVIPIETISGIYEHFIEAEGSQGRKETGAYYTPPHLAELVVDTAVEGRPLLGMRVLDPACGSGVFLVSIFNRMAQEWRNQNPNRHNKTKAVELIKILQNQLFGVDVKETACRIACFSLYLALMDQLEPLDVDAMEAQDCQLPRLLSTDPRKFAGDLPPTIIKDSFFNPDLPLARQGFDLVIGNPPWVSRGKSTQEFPGQVSGDSRVRAPQKQIAHRFMWTAPDYLKDGGTACLLLPAAVLLNRTDEFQAEWFGTFKVEKILNLSDLSFLLFPSAERPGIIIRYANTKPGVSRAEVECESPKADVSSRLGGPVQISEQDVTTLRLSEILLYAKNGEAPVLWKTRFWGTPRDVRLLTRLRDMPRLEAIVGTARKPKRWMCGQGFQPYNPKADSDTEKILKKKQPEAPWWSRDRLFLDAKRRDISLLVLKDDCLPAGNTFEQILFPRDPRLFDPPMVLVSQGATKIAFADFPLLFRDSLQSIKGDPKDAGLLKFLAVVLNSDVAKYFLFHTAANWGTERDKVHTFELLRMPFPLPAECPDPARARTIVDTVVARMDRLKKDIEGGALGRKEKVAAAKRELEPLVREYYDIDPHEAMLIKDTVEVFEPSSTPTSTAGDVPTLRKADQKNRQDYVATLCEVLNTWAKQAGFLVWGKVVFSSGAGQAAVTISKAQPPKKYGEHEASADLRDALERVRKLLPRSTGGFVRLRSLNVFDGDLIHIVKPLTLRAWTRTVALNDADEIAAAILTRGCEA
jgi:hypothetical protein